MCGAVTTERRTFIDDARRKQIVAGAIDTIADVGYARASLARIAERIGVSKGVISYHFAGKDDLIRQVVIEVMEAGRAYILPRVGAESQGPAIVRAYIESNLAFMREHRNSMVAVIEIVRSGAATSDGRLRVDGRDPDVATHLLEEQLTGLQTRGELRADFDPSAMAAVMRAAIDSVALRLVNDPDLDVDHVAKEIADIFDVATRRPMSAHDGVD